MIGFRFEYLPAVNDLASGHHDRRSDEAECHDPHLDEAGCHVPHPGVTARPDSRSVKTGRHAPHYAVTVGETGA